MFRGRCAALLWLAAVPLAAQEGAFQAEPAGCVPGTRVEAGAQVLTAEPNFLNLDERTRWDGPVLRASTCLDGRAEFELEWTARVGVFGDYTKGAVSDFGDAVVRGKLRLLGDVRDEPQLAVLFATTLPQTREDEGLGPNTLRFAAQLLFSAPVGVGRVHLNTGVSILDEAFRPHEQRDLVAWGVQFEVPLRDDARAPWFVVELAGRFGDGMPGTDARGELRAGLRLPRGRATWSAALRRGLLDADGRFGAVVFLSFRPARSGERPQRHQP
ncbi:MAG: hypothetical protein NDJ94_03185 [Vicinamibacteria bacterium]|jgi:hypothetical protein|nr:hypothetical protein [Vicinamibacteria bacterium]